MIVPALVTPFDKSGRPDGGALQELIDRLEGSVDGYLVLGSTGEAVLMAPAERQELLRGLRVKKPLWIGVGDESTSLAARHAAAAQQAGADYLLAMPPRFYDKAMSPGAFERYFTALTEYGEVWLYHVPVFTKAQFPVEVVAQLARHPKITGMKDSSAQMARFEYYRSNIPAGEFTVFTGSATTLPAAVASGAKGAIMAVANLTPRLFARIFEQQRDEGRVDSRLAALAFDIADLVVKGGSVLIKQTLRHLGVPAGYPRSPFPQQSPYWDEAKELLDRLAEEGWLL